MQKYSNYPLDKNMDKYMAMVFTVASLLPYLQHAVSLLVKLFTCGKGYCMMFSSEDEVLATNPTFHCGNGERLSSGPIFGRWFFGWVTITRTRDYATVDSIVWFIKRVGTGAARDSRPAAPAEDDGGLEDPREALHRFKLIMSHYGELRKINKPQYRNAPISPYDWQERLVSTILRQSSTTGSCVALITGGPGQGKSTLAEIIGRELRPTEDTPVWLAEYDPTAPNSLGAHLLIIERARRAGVKTLIFCVDEVDEVINAVFNGSGHTLRVSGQQNMPTCPHGSGKRTWNTLLDELAQPYEGIDIVTLMISNKTHEQIVAIAGGDRSVLRNKRVHVSFSLTGGCATVSPSTEEVSCGGAGGMPVMRC